MKKLSVGKIIITHFLFLFLAFGLVSCELFNGPKDDLLSEINREVDWANAERLTVRIEYPSAWGISNPVQGTIYQDIRKGFKFSVEFTPETAYTLVSWQVYRTSDLDGLSDWKGNLKLLETISSLGPGEVTLPAPNASGGTFNFSIHIAEPVTLIPWCDTRPHITRTEPRERSDGQSYSNAGGITLYFNCALDSDSVKFANAENDAGIWITAKGSEGNGKDWFYNPIYAIEDGFFIVNMTARVSTPPPVNSLLTVTVKGIKNMQGDAMDTYSFSYNTYESAAGVRFNSWDAVYDDKSKVSQFHGRRN